MKKIIVLAVFVMLPSFNSFAASSLKCSSADGTLMRGEEQSEGKTTVYYLLWGKDKYYDGDKKIAEVKFDETTRKELQKGWTTGGLAEQHVDTDYAIRLTVKTDDDHEDSDWVICHLSEYPDPE